MNKTKDYLKIIIAFVIIFTFILSTANSIQISKISTSKKSGRNPDTLYVGGDGPGNYTSIQEAIDNASEGDTVYVFNGTYFENVVVDKSITLTGEDKNTTVIDGGGTSHVIYFTEGDWASINGFTIQHSDISVGIKVESRYNSITNNVIKDNLGRGIQLLDSNNYVAGNTFFNNGKGNIVLEQGGEYSIVIDNIMFASGITFAKGDEGSRNYWRSQTIENNMVNNQPIRYYKNTEDFIVPVDTGQIILGNCTNITIQNLNLSNVHRGIQLGWSTHNNIINNTIMFNDIAIFLDNSGRNNIHHNIISDNGGAIFLHRWPCSNNNITDNEIKNNGYAILTYGDLGSNHGNLISGNLIASNGIGIYLDNTYSNTITENTIINNNDIGISCVWTWYNQIYHNNFIDNAGGNAYDPDYNSWWNDTYPSGGNYWSDYNGEDNFHGPAQNIPGSDGIGDTAHPIPPGYTYDYYPLMEPWGDIVYVDDDNTGGPWDGTLEHPYQYIQDGIDNATEGDTVYVFNGTYYENIIVNESLTLTGEDKNNTIIDGSGNGEAVNVTSYSVKIDGFTIQNSGIGIVLNEGQIIVTNNIISSSNGIYLSSSANSIFKNTITSNDHYGIYLFNRSSYNNIYNNTISGHGSCGIALAGAMEGYGTCHNYIADNSITNYGVGIYFSGLWLTYNIDNKIFRNFIANNYIGIWLEATLYTGITFNTIVDNDRGIEQSFTFGDDYIHHNNFINNTNQIVGGNSYTSYDNGYSFPFNPLIDGGNYWSDYTGEDYYHGPGQNLSGWDGIGDTPYTISGVIQDNYPFMGQDGWLQNIPPYIPSYPNPDDGATDVSIDADLSWEGGDPDASDTVTYDVYFDTVSPPITLVSENQTETTYDPGTLEYETTHYWKIVSWDNHNASTVGPIWQFTTEEEDDTTPPTVDITKPEKAIYWKNKKILPFFVPFIMRNIDIEVDASDLETGVNRVEFYIDDELQEADITEPYNWTWNERAFFRHTIRVIAYDNANNSASDELIVWKFF